MRMNIARWLSDAAARWPRSQALSERERQLTYAELAGIAGGLASELSARGVRAGDRVVIVAERGIAAAAMIFATHAIGAVAVVVNDRLRTRQLSHILQDIDATVVARGSSDLLLPPGLRDDRVLDLSVLPAPARFEPVERSGTDLAHVIYTSGSTGLPRGVVHTHGSVSAGVAAVSSYLGMHRDDRVAGLLAFSSVYGLNQLLCTIATGASLVVERSLFAADMVSALRADAVTIVAGVPPLWMQLLAVPAFSDPLPALRQMQNAGGHLPVNAVRKLRSAQPQAELFLQYGMTETWRGTFLSPELVDAKPGSMGKAMPDVEILLVREDGMRCEAGETGEIVHAGPTIADGYWSRPSLTHEVFRDHPFRPGERAVYSGDHARSDSDGFLQYVGRRDRIIKTQGHRVGPDEVADVLHASGQVAEAVITGEEDAERGQRIVAWVVLSEQGTLQQLKRYCRAELPPHMQPSRIEVMTSIPKLASGKYDLAGLRAAGADPAATATVDS